MSYEEIKMNYAAVKKLATGQWLRVYEALAPELAHAMKKHPKHVMCPVHGGRDGFRFYRNVSETGGGVCNSCGAFHDGFDLLAWVKGWTKSESLYGVATIAGFHVSVGRMKRAHTTSKPTPKPDDATSKARQSAKAKNAMERLYRDSLPAHHPKAEPLRDYLAGRGLGAFAVLPHSLRYHPALAYWEANDSGKFHKVGTYPAMLALVTDTEGNPVSIHRTYITQDGRKAPVSSPKKLMPPIREGALKGAAIKFSAPTHELAITEGIETALAVSLGTGKPIWAAVTAGGLEAVKVPTTVRKVWIMADLDRSKRGEQAAKVLADRLTHEGREVHICLPSGAIPSDKKSVDWLDVYNDTSSQEGAQL